MFRDFKKYEIFEDGRIFSYAKNKWLKPQINKNGYFQIILSDNDGNLKNYLYHRVIFEACSQAPIPEGMQVNHINEDKSDNRFENLNLMTPKQNANYGSRNERMKKSKINHPMCCKQVEQYDKDGNLIQRWPSINEVYRQLGYSFGCISECCRGKRKTAYGYFWKFTS